MKKVKNYINGNLISHSPSSKEIYNPSTGEVIGQVVLSNKIDLDEAINSSFSNLNAWIETTPLKLKPFYKKRVTKYFNYLNKDKQ